MPRLGLLKSTDIFLISTKCMPAFSVLFRGVRLIESKEMNEEWYPPTLGVHFKEVSVLNRFKEND